MPTYNFKAPALPTYPPVYDQGHGDQLNYALRLYFNRLDAYNASVGTTLTTTDEVALSASVLSWLGIS